MPTSIALLSGYAGVIQVKMLLHDLRSENKINFLPNEVEIRKYVASTVKE
jgi:hypothetical protein